MTHIAVGCKGRTRIHLQTGEAIARHFSPSHKALDSGERLSKSNRHFLLAFGNLPFPERTAHTGTAHSMPYLDQSQPRRPADRVLFEEATPVLLRFSSRPLPSVHLHVL